MAHEAGKGDNRRPGNDEAFRNNYDAIFGKKKKPEETDVINHGLPPEKLYYMQPIVTEQDKTT
jgi:hypothetical protein